MADKKLKEVRPEFIERSNPAVISQLLDDLLHRGVLSDEELEEVNVKNKRQEQARTLIDNVRRKGPEASCFFIDFLRARDPYLAEQLDLQNVPAVGQPIEGNISKEKVQFLKSKNGIRLCPQNDFQQIQTTEGTEIYPINDPKTRTRLALIICNIKFEYSNDRLGAEVDLEQLTLLLQDLGYKVETETNLSSEGITTCLKKFAAREEHKTSDGMFVVLMSHGYQDSLCGVHSKDKQSDIFSIKTVFSTFNNINCPALRGKPKVVIIQACRGEQNGYMIENTEDSAASAAASLQSDSHTVQFQTDAVRRVHVESDFICLYSTTPDHVSWRHPETGSLFINQLIENIKNHAWNCNLEEVFRKVQQHFANNPCQMPSRDRNTLTKKFYLFPGH
ncbi:caspase-1-like isoform X2 [Pseudonaja textilis]|uniref:caspase-1-like isoform X2 n=1 Tax=Pseudonaja textilis TaxID=8673 RepID=UPI000EAA36EC|nr:caspase-1-like isoform X2 [Pseudonaja textilis]